VSPPWKAVFARHGTTDWNLERRYLGHTDMPLSDVGRSQAKELGKAVAHFCFDAIYSSDLRRAYETAAHVQQVIYKTTGILPSLTVDPLLREMNFGRIEGLTYEEATDRFPDEMRRWYENIETLPPPGGEESLTQVRDRMIMFMNQLARQEYRKVLIVSHGGTIRSWLSYMRQKPFWEVTIKHGQWIEYDVGEKGQKIG
jgi:broad specificity phosphatase PhoE